MVCFWFLVTKTTSGIILYHFYAVIVTSNCTKLMHIFYAIECVFKKMYDVKWLASDPFDGAV